MIKIHIQAKIKELNEYVYEYAEDWPKTAHFNGKSC